MLRATMFRAFAVAAVVGILVVQSAGSAGDPAKPLKPSATAPRKSSVKSAASAAARPAAKPMPQPAGLSKIQAALDAPAELDFVDTPLKDIVDSLRARLGITIVLDAKALNDAGVTPDTTFTKQIKGVPFHSALHLLLADKDMAYFTLGDEVLMLTTADVAKSHLVVCVYEVRRFADPDQKAAKNWVPMGYSGIPQGEFAVANTPTEKPAPGAANHPMVKKNTQRTGSAGSAQTPPVSTPFDSLCELITSTVAPSSWDTQGGVGSIRVFGGNIVVAQTEEIQAAIAELLSALDATRGPIDPRTAIPGLTINPLSPQVARIEKALDAPTEMDFVDTPLKDVIDSQKSRHGIEIQLDTKALNGAGISPDTTFTSSIKGTSLRTALSLLLGEKELAFVVEDDVMLITTSDEAKNYNVIDVYPVEKLLGAADRASGALDYDSLIEAITSSVAPASWDSEGGLGVIAPFPPCKVLVIAQTQQIQREIGKLLTKLAESKPAAPKPSASEEPMPSQNKALAAKDNSPVVRIYPMSSILGSPAAEDERKDLQRFSDMIRRLIEPESWTRGSAYIGFVSGSLVIRQTPAIQREIQNLIDEISAVNQAPQPQVGSMGGGMGGFGGGGMGGGFGGPPG